MAKTYMIEAVVDGTWHWYAGRSEIRPWGTIWATTDERAARYESRREVEREQKRIGGITYIRER